jgi:hypothetical protein
MACQLISSSKYNLSCSCVLHLLHALSLCVYWIDILIHMRQSHNSTVCNYNDDMKMISSHASRGCCAWMTDEQHANKWASTRKGILDNPSVTPPRSRVTCGGVSSLSLSLALIENVNLSFFFVSRRLPPLNTSQSLPQSCCQVSDYHANDTFIYKLACRSIVVALSLPRLSARLIFYA